MKYLSLLPVAFFSLALQAQTAGTSAAAAGNTDASVSRDAVQSGVSAGASAAGQATSRTGQATATSTAATNVSAELTKKIDTKNAKVGDAIEARTMSAAKLADGTKLPRGTRLLGKVTDVQAKSSADQSSHLAFTLDRAVLHDGREIPVHAVLTSVTGRAAAAASTGDDMAMASGGAMAAGGASAGAGRGGMLGGVGSTAGGVVGGAANTVGSTVGNVGAAAQSETGLVAHDASAAVRVANSTGSSVALDHVPVANLPGVTLSNTTSASGSGSLDASGRNINLESGTQMTLNVSASQQ